MSNNDRKNRPTKCPICGSILLVEIDGTDFDGVSFAIYKCPKEHKSILIKEDGDWRWI